MRPRITIDQKDGELRIWLNPAGRDLLVRELQKLDERNDHFHLGPEEFDGEVPTQSLAYEAGGEVIGWGKVMYRPDEWDAEHFPPVIRAPTE